MRGVQGQWGLEIVANGRDLQLDTSRLLNFTIINNIHEYLPALAFSFSDDSGQDMNNLIKDGGPIKVTVGVPGKKMSDPYDFVCMGQPSIKPQQSSSVIGVNAILNKAAFSKKVVDKSYSGSTSSVIGELASAVGLKFDGDTTNDIMNWLPNGTTISEFARNLMRHSFVDEATAMIMAVTDKGVLRYKDLAKLATGGPNKELVYDGADPFLSYAADPKSLVSNSGYGYGATTLGVKEDGSIFEANKVAMTMLSAANSLSETFQSVIGNYGTRLINLPPLSGNTHENWFQALHQNPRIKSTYAYDIQVLTDYFTDIDLLDVIFFKGMDNATRQEATALTGNYIVTATTKFFMDNRYMEKIVITGQGVGGT